MQVVHCTIVAALRDRFVEHQDLAEPLRTIHFLYFNSLLTRQTFDEYSNINTGKEAFCSLDRYIQLGEIMYSYSDI